VNELEQQAQQSAQQLETEQHSLHSALAALALTAPAEDKAAAWLAQREAEANSWQEHQTQLLRQTSFKALEEPVLFAGEHLGTHTARFGEIEQRGVALTQKGRELYDRLLAEAGTGKDNLTHQLHLQEVFRAFPDSEMLLRRQGLAWFRYRLTPSGEAHRSAFGPGDDPQPLIERGWVVAQPIT
jgi:uncharacterized glyoxalase superfamily metalloenzyme YdcJ